MWRQARVCVREVWRAQKQNSPAGRRKAFSQELKHPSTCWQRSRLGPLPVAPWMKMWNFIIEPPDEACEGGKTEKRKRRRRRRRGGQVPGAHCDGTPHRHGDMGQGAFGGRGCSGRGEGEGACSEQQGGQSFGMNYPPAEPALWRCWMRGHVLSGPQTHTQARPATTTRLCVRPASHNSYSAFSTQTLVRSWRGWIRSARLVKQDGSIHSGALNTNYSH